MAEYWKLSVTVPREASDAVGDFFRGCGVSGVVEEEIGEGSIAVAAYFREEQAAVTRSRFASFRRILATEFPGAENASVCVSRVVEEDWAESWKQGFDPIDVGERLRIRTPWTPPTRDRTEIEILPAMAFGTGHHASTNGCLQAIESLARERGGVARTLDVGTGSGILAFAAAALGAPRVLAIDDDPVAIAAAIENRERNSFSSSVELRQAALDELAEERFDLIVANLFRNLLCELAESFSRVSTEDGMLIVSGFLDEDAGAVEGALGAAGWRAAGRLSLDGWTTLTLERRGGCTGS